MSRLFFSSVLITSQLRLPEQSSTDSGPQTTGICHLTVLDARSLRSRGSFKVVRETQLQASPMASGGCWPSLVLPGMELHHADLCFHA